MKNLLFFIFLAIGTIARAQVAINTDGSLPDNSAMLDVKTPYAGILIPRMNADHRDAIVSPATGLLIFCTDDNLFYSNKGTPGTPNWVAVNSQWSSNGTAITYGGGYVGIGTLAPSTILDIGGGNNWDLQNGEGDFRIGNSSYRIKMGVALGGGGAGAAGIMQYGQPGGYNVLKFGAQGNYLLYLNGSTQKVGIGTDNPVATLDIIGSLRVANGSQGAGKMLYSDANGMASWESGNTHTIGESYGGGVVFFIYDNGQHGLISSTTDQSNGIRWYGGSYTNTRARADGIGAGKANTAIIIANQGPVDGAAFAATVCNEYSVTAGGVTYADWYLPSKFELNIMYIQRNVIGGFGSTWYWSSTESDNGNAWYQDLVFGYPWSGDKSISNIHARAIRSF